MRNGQCTLVLFCKRPERSKRRLAAEIGNEAARQLAVLLLDCALEDVSHWAGPVVISPDDIEDTDWATGLTDGATIVPQGRGNLGQRIAGIDRRLRAAGRTALLYIGADCPALTTEELARAADALGTSDVVLGQADDGGVVFMGSGSPWPGLAGLPWSTPRLADALAESCEAAGLAVTRQGAWRDVDHASDLGPLRVELRDDTRPARRRLKRWLESSGWKKHDSQG